MSATESAIASRLVERSLRTANAASIADIHQWGEFHQSRLSLRVLARLACQQDPEAALNVRANRSRLAKAPLNLEALCALAASLALRAKSGEERADALELLDLARERLGNRLPAEYHDLHVMTAYLSGRPERARKLAKAYGGRTDVLRDALHCQDAHPRNGGSANAYLKRLKDFTGWPELIVPDGPCTLSIEGIRTGPVPERIGGPLISVVMTCFEPGPELLAAVRSVVAQSWQNWELLLVDDGSGPRYEDVLRQAAALDKRVKLLIQPENGGTYQARNRAMAVAAGEFITGLDSDDWAHPMRLQRQVRALRKNPKLIMVESRSLAVHEDLSLVIDPQVAIVAARSTPIMFRAKEVMKRVGFYDEVRKSADSEYRHRIRVAFGEQASVRMGPQPLTLVRHNDTTLSAGEVSRHWMAASRLAYHSGFTEWHGKIARGRKGPFLESFPRPRPFPVTGDITRSRVENQAIEYTCLFAADWRELDLARRSMLDDAAELTAKGHAVGLVHCPDWVRVDGKRPLIDTAVLKSACDHGFDFVDLEAAPTAPIIVPTTAYAELFHFEHPELAQDRVSVHRADPGSVAAEAPLAIEAPAVRETVYRTMRPKDLLAVGGGLLSVAATTALASSLDVASLPWVASVSSVIWACASWALVARRIAARPYE
jgi:hypothetical protein